MYEVPPPERNCVDHCYEKTPLPAIIGIVTSILFYKKTKLVLATPVIFIITWCLAWAIRSIYNDKFRGPSCPCGFI